MLPIQKYANLIDSIFGVGTATFDTTKNISNRVTGAYQFSDDYSSFKKNFKARLKRLKKIYDGHPTYLKEILVQVNEVASLKNWQGAYAELAAFDYLNSDLLKRGGYLCEPIQPNITLKNSETFALELGKQEANVDGLVKDYSLYFDIKCLKDNVTEILEGIYEELRQHLGVTGGLHIMAEHPLDISYDDFSSKRRELLAELKKEINLTTKKTHLKSKIISNLSFSLQWGKGVNIIVREHNPFLYAKNYHKTIFNYANKFVKNRPSIIVLVKFPWYNLVINDFGDSNKQFYRAFARRAFCQYQKDSTKFNSFNSSFKGADTIFDVSRYLSGIMFLEDNTILSKTPNDTNIKSFMYLNPNALNPINRTTARSYIFGLHPVEYDDFENDNY